MRRFRDISVGHKLTLIIVVTSCAAVLLACITVATYDVLDFRKAVGRLDFSKIESGMLQVENIQFDIYDCVADALRTLAITAQEKGLELAYAVGPGVPAHLHGDPNRLRQVLVNLLSNAVKFTDMGEVTVGVACVDNSKSPGLLRFSVRDTGIGIEPDRIGTLFRPFTQADSSTTRRYGGSGLGLAISAQLVTLLRGRIWAESTPGAGSTFHFTAEFAPALDAAERNLLNLAALRGCPVLIVEHRAANRELLAGIVREWQMEPEMAGNAADALALLRKSGGSSGPFAVVLLDSDLPLMQEPGFEELIRGRLPASPPVVALTSGRHAEPLRSPGLGIADYLMKPIRKSELLACLLRLLTSAPAGMPPEPVTAAAPRPLRIIVVEDNTVNQVLVLRMLQEMGHQPTLARTGNEAVELSASGQVDVILMDVQMPEMDGYEATAAIRQREVRTGVHTRIVAMTAHALSGDHERCLAAGMDSYISKPLNVAALRQELDKLSAHANVCRAWDEHQGLAGVGGDVSLLQELVAVHLRECPKLVQQLLEASAARDWDTVQRAAHTLKGELLCLGASAAADLAKSIELDARQGKGDECPPRIDRLTSELHHVHEALENFSRRAVVAGD